MELRPVRSDGTWFGKGQAGLWESTSKQARLPVLKEEVEESGQEVVGEVVWGEEVVMAAAGAKLQRKCEKRRALHSILAGDAAVWLAVWYRLIYTCVVYWNSYSVSKGID